MECAGPSPQIFVVDWPATWSSLEEVLVAQRALEEATRRVALRGDSVRCLQSTFLPTERRWICVLEADNPAVVRLAVAMAQIPERHLRSGIDLRGSVRGPVVDMPNTTAS
jgi:hypothetical protein